MVKRLAVPIVILAAMLYCVPAFGAVAGTAHEQSIGDQGVCSACHIPHKALGARLWPQSMSGQEAVFGVVGSLCYYCHGTGGGAGLVNAVQIFAMDDTIGAFSHGRDVNQLPDPTGTMDTSLPYGGDSRFQCTTCHNVHDDTSKPFLQDDIDQLCARCHKLRQFVGGSDQAVQGAWGSGYYGTSNPGSHPMGTDVYGDSDSPANSPINITGAAVFTYAYGATSAHNLGGHLIDGATTPGSGAGVTCATCHSVHGVQTDADPPSGGTAPVANLLTIDQPTATGGFDNAQDGNGDPRNALCEGCHYTTATTIDASTGAAYGGSYRPNPGASAYTHPVDDLGASMEASVSAFPQYWPVSSSSATNVSPVPICESCHTPHPNANSNRANIVAASGTHILRAPEDDSLATYICFQCHDFTLGAGHHPSNVAMGRMGDSVIGNNDATLTCSDCHSGAHNWTTLGLGLDPQWEPAGNGRSRLSSVERVTAGASKECEDCHYNNNTIPCPTNNSTNGGGAVSHTWRTSTSYQDIGEGTHYLGTTTMDYALGSFGGSSFNATSDDWSGQGQANARWSRFDG
ncbi:cytochrome c3 family protein, partial [Candidatus Poribacteria bacterium]|nr:cytochrome c3 family protein [Candidatus Poribacteria bacterium]